mgnify:CR=1 FL=1
MVITSHHEDVDGPDLTLLFDVPPAVSRERLERAVGDGRELDKFEREREDFFVRVRDAYLARAKAEPGRIRLIDASGDQAQIRKLIEPHLKF